MPQTETQNISAPMSYVIGYNYIESFSNEVDKLREDVEKLRNENDVKIKEMMLMEEEVEITRVTAQLEYLKERHERKSTELRDLKKRLAYKKKASSKENLADLNNQSGNEEEKFKMESRIKSIEEELKKFKHYFEDIQKGIDKKIQTQIESECHSFE